MTDNQVIQRTAWDTISGKYSDLVDVTHAIQIKGGRVLYYLAALSSTSYDFVRLERFEPGTLKINRRYISVDTEIELVPIPQ